MKKQFLTSGHFMKLSVAAVVMTLLIGFQSCEQYEILPPGNDDIGEVTFSGTIQPILSTNCAGCHNGDTHPLDLTDGNAYSAIQSFTPEQAGQMINTETPEESVLYIMALNGDHGYFNLSGKQEAQILKWITEGALDN